MTEKPSNNKTFAILRDALISSVLAYLVFFPISALVLDGYELNFLPKRPLQIAALVFVIRLITASIAVWRKKDGHETHHVATTTGTKSWQKFLLLGLFVGVAILPFVSSKYFISIGILALIYVLLGLGLNIVVGLAGLLDLGYVAFYAVGAYGYALASQHWGFSFWEALPLAAGAAALAGAVLGFPVLRMHGDYLAIVTLGFGEIIYLVLTNWVEVTGGPNGLSAPFPTLFNLEFKRSASEGFTPFHEFFGIDFSADHKYIFLYLLVLVIVAIVMFFVNRLKIMPVGRAWEALRQDEIACRALGINHVVVKLLAFSMGASIGGLAGVIYAAYQGFINPTSFHFFESALILAIVVFGGMGSSLGVALAAIVLTVLPEMLREFSEFRMILFGIMMVVMMIWRPRGLITEKRRVIRSEAIPS